MSKDKNLSKLSYLMLCMEPKTLKPYFPQCAIFPTHAEALKAKGFLRGSGMFVMLVPIASHNSKEEFCQEWKDRVRLEMYESLGIEGAEQSSNYFKS